jgi:hypothetical protein
MGLLEKLNPTKSISPRDMGNYFIELSAIFKYRRFFMAPISLSRLVRALFEQIKYFSCLSRHMLDGRCFNSLLVMERNSRFERCSVVPGSSVSLLWLI